uniref:Uncharacterized protein n=1 Tax=Oryza glumipatula TaxID=40148 RepID=A0A0D9ZKX5_9ORYZ
MANNQMPPSLFLYFSLFPSSPHLCGSAPLHSLSPPPPICREIRSRHPPYLPARQHPSSHRARGRREGCEVGLVKWGARRPGMDKLVQFGRKAWFVVRVLSGYEERRIRAHRLQMQQRIARAQAKKEELRKQPEQIILSEVRQMVQQMQALNQQLEEAETAIDEYFKPIDKNAKIIMDMQLEKEEKQIKEMTKVMQDQIAMQREIASKRAQATAIESKDAQTQTSDKIAEGPPKEETMK